jgi:hypothetical protein
VTAPSGRLAAQVVANRSLSYLHPTDVVDARAVWVNPAGLSVRQLASIHMDVAVTEPGGRGRLGQITAGFSSRGLGFSYQRDPLDTGLVAHTYRVGLAGASGGLAAGVAAAHYRGAANSTGWDVGIVYLATGVIALGGTVANIGQPDVRGQKLPATFIAGATVAPFGQRFALSAHATMTREQLQGYAIGSRWTLPIGFPLTLLARLDADSEFRTTALAFGLSAGVRDVAGAVVTTPGNFDTADAANVYGVIARELGR